MESNSIAKVFYNWDLIEVACRDIYKDIVSDNFKPDYIIGLTRGGLVPGVVLSHRFGCPLHALNVSLRDGHTKESKDWMIEDALNNKQILIVDDINDSGATLLVIKSIWAERFSGNWDNIWRNNVRTAVIVDNASSEAIVDYRYTTINKAEDNVWIVFPWEKE